MQFWRQCAILQHVCMWPSVLLLLQEGRQDIINTCLEEYEQIAVWVIVRNRQGNVASVKFPDEDMLNAV